MPTPSESVAITGLGAISPLGGDVGTTWSGLLDGRSAVRALDDDWAAALPVRIAARAAVEPAGMFSRVDARRLDRSSQFALIALREAWADAGFTGPAGTHGAPPGDRVGVVVGSGLGGLSTLLHNYDVLNSRGARGVSPFALPMLMANSPAAQVSMEIGAQAAVHAPTSACAAGAEAVAAGLDLIRLGRADVVVVGGAEAIINPLTIAGFASMTALSCHNEEPHRASRPFDKKRDGFVIAEGAAMLVLESMPHARARGARVYGELAGAGVSADAHHIARQEPSGRSMARALRTALDDAGLGTPDVAHVNAHATSTPGGDLVESRAISSVFGPRATPVSAIKSMTGHLIGASGALAAVSSVLTVHHRLAPPTINVEDPDDAVELDVVRDVPRALPAGQVAAVSNSSGFGGHNVVLAFRTAS
ncbi:beta-ketoacyl-[acyl-carrier-protein] synthase family protein [Streptomyces sp. NBC_01387]|uniref:beta-ketoacyl-[acyl-carrier-protein] synthase family protein n=1 Tax=Streptomyces sp. NBC_01387 TaxID=2903849 RepID=UPI00324DB261